MLNALWLIPAILGGIVFNKYACIWLHKQPQSQARDTMLRVLNGGPGPLPK